MSDGKAGHRRYRTLARLLLLGGLGLCLFSVFFYTSVFWSAGRGIALHSGRVSLIIGSGTGGMKPGLVCYRTEPVLLYKPIIASRGTLFIALPLWAVGVPGAVLLAMDAWVLLRLRRGACCACGYSLAGLRTGACCPECGVTPDPKLASREERVRAIGRELLARALVMGTCAGVLVVLVWVFSGFYGLAFRPNSRTAMALRHGRFEMYTSHVRAAPPGPRTPPSWGYVPVSVPAWFTPWETSPEFVPVAVALPEWAPPPERMACPPLDPIGWRLGWEFAWVPAAGATTIVVPLWWIGLPLLACAIPKVRRRLSRGSRKTATRIAAAANVPSSGERS